jgi:hypothetical protein
VLQSGHAADILVRLVEKPTDNPTSTVVLLSEVADRFSGSDQPSVGPGRISQHPLHAPGAPRLLRRNSPVPLLRTGPDVETRPKSPSGGIRAKGTKVACGMSSPRKTARGRYYARPIRHSVDQKVAPNKNYCRSVTIQTLGLKAI